MSLTSRQSDDQAVFGPVPSRRLGLSLGVDLLWPKTCTLDCVYCECGPTTHKTTKRGRFRPAEDVLAQVRKRLEQLDAPPDHITLAGSGEPTLHLDLGLVLRRLREMNAGRVAVLTNGTLCFDERVRDELCQAQVLVPSLDAVGQRAFQQVNRPAKGLSAAAMIEGLKLLRRQFKGQFILEILLVEGLNDTPGELEGLMAAAKAIGPDAVQLNTIVRPPAVAGFRPVDDHRLAAIAAAFDPPAQVIAPPRARAAGDHGHLARQAVEMTRRRPCTIEDIAAALGLAGDAAADLVASLRAAGLMGLERHDGREYYRGV